MSTSLSSSSTSLIPSRSSRMILRLVPLFRGTPSIIYALMLATSATPVFGIAVLGPVLGPTSAAAVGLVALTISLPTAEQLQRDYLDVGSEGLHLFAKIRN